MSISVTTNRCVPGLGLALICSVVGVSLPVHAADASPFSLACISSGGTAGTAVVRSSNSRVTLYAGGPAILSLSLAPTADVSFMRLALTGQPAGEPRDPTIQPGEGRFLSASKLQIEGLGGTVGKGVEFCLRLK